jgi:hypothetical protein
VSLDFFLSLDFDVNFVSFLIVCLVDSEVATGSDSGSGEDGGIVLDSSVNLKETLRPRERLRLTRELALARGEGEEGFRGDESTSGDEGGKVVKLKLSRKFGYVCAICDAKREEDPDAKVEEERCEGVRGTEFAVCTSPGCGRAYNDVSCCTT